MHLGLKVHCYDLFMHSSSVFSSIYSVPGLIMDTEGPAVKVMVPVHQKFTLGSERDKGNTIKMQCGMESEL